MTWIPPAAIDKPTPCYDNHWPYDILIDNRRGKRAQWAFAIYEAANLCGRCPLVVACHTNNADEEWVKTIHRRLNARAA